MNTTETIKMVKVQWRGQVDIVPFAEAERFAVELLRSIRRDPADIETVADVVARRNHMDVDTMRSRSPPFRHLYTAPDRNVFEPASHRPKLPEDRQVL